ncbi:MAG: hypothetical protein WC935_09355 [Thermoleophilia bacterium]
MAAPLSRPDVFEEILRELQILRQHQVPESLNDLARDDARKFRETARKAQKWTPESSAVINWPADGTVGYVPAGTTVFDLEKGHVELSNGTKEPLSNSVRGLGLEYMRSVHFHPQAGAGAFAVELDSGGIDKDLQRFPDDRPFATPPFYLDRQHHYLTHVAIIRIKIYTVFASAFFVEFGEGHESPPVLPEGIQSPSIHFADGTTTDAFTAVVLRPARFNPRTGIGDAMSASDAALNAALGGAAMEGFFMLNHTFIVWNRGATNSLDVNIQGAFRGLAGPVPPSAFVDDASTGASTAIAAGATTVFAFARQYGLLRVRVRSTVAGSPTTFEVDAGQLVAT